MTQLLQPNREPRELRPRAAIFGVAAVLLMLLLVARLYHLQIVRGVELSAKSRDNFVKELVDPAPRGFIFDRRGRLLADNRPSFDVYLTPAFCRSRCAEVLERLAVHLDLPREKVDETLKYIESLRRSKGAKRLERERPYLIKLDIAPDRERTDQLDRIEADRDNLDGVDVVISPHRYYPYGPLLAHSMGYLSEVSQAEYEASKGRYRRGDFIGRRGIERSLESELRGKDGRRRIAVDAKGHALDQDIAHALIPERDRLVPSTPGRNVVLSIDLALQTVADRALREKGRAGAVVAVDVHTGYVLAMVSLPAYDPNIMTGRISRKELQALVDDPLEPLFQRAVQQHYHPGSTFKIVTALAGLEAGAVGLESTTSCGGGYSLGARRWRCWQDRGHGGGIGAQRALMQSCDTYYYWIADKIGLDPIADMAFRLGFGKTTGIELSPETPGLIPTPAFHQRVDKHYSKGFALNAAIGQGSVNVTPLQLAMAYAALANGGTLYKPRLVRRIEDPSGEVVRVVQPEPVRTLDVKPAHLATVIAGLERVVGEAGGTAYSKRLADVKVAGKTGTAQTVKLGEKRLKTEDMAWETRDHAWFAAFAPAEAPEIAVAVINEHGGHGGSDAAPIAMAVFQAYFDLKKQELDDGRPLSEDAIARLQPAPRYATEMWAMRRREAENAAARQPLPAIAAPAYHEPGPDEPTSSAAEVADPSQLRRTPAPDRPAPTPGGATPASPSPE